MEGVDLRRVARLPLIAAVRAWALVASAPRACRTEHDGILSPARDASSGNVEGRPPLGCRVQPRGANQQQLLRGSEGNLEHEGDAGRVERVVPGLGWDARVAEKIRNVGHAVYHVAVD